MRYISAQFIPYLEDNIWLENAQKSNKAAQKLLSVMESVKGIKITQNVESNAIFFILPKDITNKLRERYFFYDWDVSLNEMRLVCSWDTTDDDIVSFTDYLKLIVSEI